MEAQDALLPKARAQAFTMVFCFHLRTFKTSFHIKVPTEPQQQSLLIPLITKGLGPETHLTLPCCAAWDRR